MKISYDEFEEAFEEFNTGSIAYSDEGFSIGKKSIIKLSDGYKIGVSINNWGLELFSIKEGFNALINKQDIRVIEVENLTSWDDLTGKEREFDICLSLFNGDIFNFILES
jgi:hypothetical protein